ncbi:SGNH/GDSL hydrolase family protein [Chitinophaga sp. GCM10012297]|uniref:SGNH/GDSL hydrolase family protein n=1 Tax=Chitinophaga chungangae TaxID=2821488 RepID=A0ABS3YJC0_9BACT|nr:SGNH/GDSL hydrolase family protein [Chitinophaga chungangae]MBO9154747.1 SGNH/GDSL hydrolase family protein [Chitinophaga chungangae]
MKRLLYSIGLGLGTLCAQAQVKPFQQNDRVIFVGNSITEAGAYVSYVYLYYMTHFPGKRLVIMNGGIGGDKASDIYRRLDYDILAKKPNVLILTFGMNDTGYFEFNNSDSDKTAAERIEASRKNYVMIEDRLKKLPDIQKVLMSSPPYDETAKIGGAVFRGKHKAMLEVVKFQEAAAKQNGWPFADLFRPMTALNAQLQQKDSAFTLIGPDRVHPGNAGHLVMASLFLKNQGLSGVPVADVRIDAAGGKVKQEVNCSISNFSASTGKVSYNYLAASLPFPIDTVARTWGNDQKQADALKWIPFTDEFNREMLEVDGLQPGDYNLLIDGHAVGEWSAGAFSKGINLATVPETPQYKQATSIMQLNIRRAEVEARLRRYFWVQGNFFDKRNLRQQDNAAALDSIRKYAKNDGMLRYHEENYETAMYKELRAAWQQEIDTIIDLIYKLNKPVSHKIEIVKI